MMTKRDVLLDRMERIGRSVAEKDGTLMLLALGSIGQETERLDEYSDLDFFLIVEDGQKARFIDQLDWLEVEPLHYQFQNTKDGHKIMYQDGIYDNNRIPIKHCRMAYIKSTPVYYGVCHYKICGGVFW